MALPKTIVILMTGPIASGKGAAKYYLVNKGFSHIRLTDPIIDEIEQQRLDPTERENWLKVAVDMRKKNGKSVLAEMASKRIKDGGKYVIDPLRYPEDIKFFKENYDAFTFFIDAPPEVRYKRTYYNPNGYGISKEEFKRRDDREMNPSGKDKEFLPNINECKELSDFVVENDGNLDHLNERLDGLMQKLNIPLYQDEFYTEGVDM